MDTTLTISSRRGETRRAAVQDSVLDGGAVSWLWQIPLSVWHPHQFYAGQRGDPPRRDRALRVVRGPTALSQAASGRQAGTAAAIRCRRWHRLNSPELRQHRRWHASARRLRTCCANAG